MQHKFDELNINNTSGQRQRISSYREYFEVMDLPEEELEDRIALAEELEPIFVWLFLLIVGGMYSKYTMQTMLQERLTLTIKGFFSITFLNTYLQNYVEKISEEVIRVTLENQENDYYTSVNRAQFIAANEGNLLGNYREQIRAVNDGYKFKVWITENDSRVRHTHKEVNNTKLDILKPFIVGNSRLLFPKDFSMGAGAEETVNCRCHIQYTKF